jgi:hypothetical protein
MPSDAELEATLLAQIEADLAELAAHVDTWLQDRFLASESAAGLNLEDVTGLIVWLRQWQDHFESYRDDGSPLAAAGLPAVNTRLDQVRAEIDTSIATFTQMAETLPPPPG